MPTFSVEEDQKTPEEIAVFLGETYYLAKDAKADQDAYRLEFFAAAGTTFRSEGLATKVYTADDGLTESQARERAALYNTGWTVEEVYDPGKIGPHGQVVHDKRISILLREDPDLQPFVAVVPVPDVVDAKGKKYPGYTITKSIVSGSALLDDDRLKAERPDLWEDITEPSVPAWMIGVLSDAQYKKIAAAAPRVPLSPDKMTTDQMETVKQFVYEAARTKKLLVRYAKPEEIGEKED